MKQKKNLLIYALVIAAIVVIGLSIYMITSRYGSDYQKALSSEQEDICATPPGYTDESWRQHMSHHPDRYEQCLK